MRHRREAKPPSRPRVITWRLVAVSLVVGVVLGVATVPVGAAYARSGAGAASGSGGIDRFAHQAEQSLYQRRRGNAWTRWGCTRFSSPGGQMIMDYAQDRGLTPLWRCPLPQRARELPAGAWQRVEVLYAGWPWRTSYGMAERLSARYPTASVGLWRFTAFGVDWALPYLPFWPGLLGNTLFYGMLVLPLPALSRWRTLRRRAKRGLCLACAYELGEGVDACPECGLARAAS